MSSDEKKIYEDILSSWKTPQVKSSEESWTDVQNKMKTAETPVIPMNRSWVWKLSAAAAVVLALFVWRSFASNETSIESFSAIVETKLPDGSVVFLNAGSQLIFSSDDWSDDRSVELNGEAYFEVTKGSKFVVQTKNGSVEVLGTEFNVYSRIDDFGVHCYEGKVRVMNSQNELVLLPGLATESINGELLPASEFNLAAAFWKDGQFNWENANLDQVFQEVERQYGVKIIRPNIQDRIFTGSFKKLDLKDVMSIICEPMGLSFNIEQNGSVIVDIDEIVN